MRLDRTVAIALVGLGAGVVLTGWTVEAIEPATRMVEIVLGGLTAILGVAVIALAYSRSGQGWAPEAPEHGVVVSTPGDGLVEAGEPAVRDRVRAPVVAALVARGFSKAEANTAVAEGSWTDDEAAARYLRPGSLGEIPDGHALANHRAAALAELKRVRERS